MNIVPARQPGRRERCGGVGGGLWGYFKWLTEDMKGCIIATDTVKVPRVAPREYRQKEVKR